MKRREFIALIGGAACAWPTAPPAQPAKREKPFRIATVPDFGPVTRPISLDGMRDLGWVEGRDLVIVPSGFQLGGPEVNEVVKRVVADNPELILTITSGYALALHRATPSIPIVTVSCGYPVEAGGADSLSRPGKNVTGISQFAGTQVWGKLLQLLRGVKSGVTRVGVLWTYLPPTIPQEEIAPCYAELRDAERSLGRALHFIEVASSDHVAEALSEIDAARSDGLLLTSGLSFKANSTVMQFAVAKHLPTITEISWPNVQPSPLLSYGPVYAELVRSNVAYVDKIMKGAKPGDLPFQQPAKFELIVNLRTAKAIGITIPQEMFQRADSVVD